MAPNPTRAMSKRVPMLRLALAIRRPDIPDSAAETDRGRSHATLCNSVIPRIIVPPLSVAWSVPAHLPTQRVHMCENPAMYNDFAEVSFSHRDRVAWLQPCILVAFAVH